MQITIVWDHEKQTIGAIRPEGVRTGDMAIAILRLALDQLEGERRIAQAQALQQMAAKQQAAQQRAAGELRAIRGLELARG